jgi:hypothetical protein
MDITQIIASIAGAVLGITSVGAFTVKYTSKVIKYVRIAADAINALEHVAEALDDGTLSVAEIESIKADVAKFRKDLAS